MLIHLHSAWKLLSLAMVSLPLAFHLTGVNNSLADFEQRCGNQPWVFTAEIHPTPGIPEMWHPDSRPVRYGGDTKCELFVPGLA